jgi:molecular chaperone GrpE
MQHETEETEIAEAEVVDAEVVEPEAAEEAPPAAADGEAAEGAKPEEPAESELDRALRERDEYLELAQRTRAELENYRRRVSGEAAEAERRGRATVARDLIGALDNLERALLAAGVSPDGAVGDGSEPLSQEVSAQTALAEGVAIVYREFRDGLGRAGIDSFDQAGEKFDPTRHEAVATASAEGVEPGLVVETLEKGYALGETVLRPARVVVCG